MRKITTYTHSFISRRDSNHLLVWPSPTLATLELQEVSTVDWLDLFSTTSMSTLVQLYELNESKGSVTN